MGKDVHITCDGCTADITYTGNSVDYRLVLSNQSKAPWYEKEDRSGGVVTDMMIYPPVSRTHYFCGLKCLDRWREKDGN